MLLQIQYFGQVFCFRSCAAVGAGPWVDTSVTAHKSPDRSHHSVVVILSLDCHHFHLKPFQGGRHDNASSKQDTSKIEHKQPFWW